MSGHLFIFFRAGGQSHSNEEDGVHSLTSGCQSQPPHLIADYLRHQDGQFLHLLNSKAYFIGPLADSMRCRSSVQHIA